MPEAHDGPHSPYFTVLPIQGNANLAGWTSAGSGQDSGILGMSPEMAAALKAAPGGYCVCWGIPFEIGDGIVLSDAPVSIDINPVKARWLVFLHTSDIRPLQPGPGGIISPMRGRGMLAEHAADYVICFTDGSQARASIRRRHQVGAFQRGWGENCFESVAHHKPYPLRAAHEQLSDSWGNSQARNFAGDDSAWVNWLWAWENPLPEKAIAGFQFVPASGVVVLSAISAGNLASLPLRWQTRRKAFLALPVGESFQPEMDQDGLL